MDPRAKASNKCTCVQEKWLAFQTCTECTNPDDELSEMYDIHELTFFSELEHFSTCILL